MKVCRPCARSSACLQGRITRIPNRAQAAAKSAGTLDHFAPERNGRLGLENSAYVFCTQLHGAAGGGG